MKAGAAWGSAFAVAVALLITALYWVAGVADRLVLVLTLTPLLGAILLTPLLRPDARVDTELVTDPSVPSELHEMLRSNWKIAADFFRTNRWHARAHLIGLGLLTSACVGLSAHGAIKYIITTQPVTTARASVELSNRCLVSVVVLAAVGTAFSLSSGSIGVRIARRDLTPRFVACQIRGLLCIVLSAVVTGGMLVYGEVVDCWPKAFVAGAVAGLLGEQLLSTAFDSIALIFGVSLGGDNLDEFEFVQGLDDDERLRLKELGVQSIQGLAYSSTAALYMSSRYSYQCICDWQDQALFVLHVGERHAQAFQRSGLRRASDVRAFLETVERQRAKAASEGEPNLSEGARAHQEALLRELGIKTPEQALLSLEVLLADPHTAQMDAVRRCYPRFPTTEVEADVKARTAEPVLS